MYASEPPNVAIAARTVQMMPGAVHFISFGMQFQYKIASGIERTEVKNCIANGCR
jgi:hypothetical protein